MLFKKIDLRNVPIWRGTYHEETKTNEKRIVSNQRHASSQAQELLELDIFPIVIQNFDEKRCNPP